MASLGKSVLTQKQQEAIKGIGRLIAEGNEISRNEGFKTKVIVTGDLIGIRVRRVQEITLGGIDNALKEAISTAETNAPNTLKFKQQSIVGFLLEEGGLYDKKNAGLGNIDWNLYLKWLKVPTNITYAKEAEIFQAINDEFSKLPGGDKNQNSQDTTPKNDLIAEIRCAAYFQKIVKLYKDIGLAKKDLNDAPEEFQTKKRVSFRTSDSPEKASNKKDGSGSNIEALEARIRTLKEELEKATEDYNVIVSNIKKNLGKKLSENHEASIKMMEKQASRVNSDDDEVTLVSVSEGGDTRGQKPKERSKQTKVKGSFAADVGRLNRLDGQPSYRTLPGGGYAATLRGSSAGDKAAGAGAAGNGGRTCAFPW